MPPRISPVPHIPIPEDQAFGVLAAYLYSGVTAVWKTLCGRTWTALSRGLSNSTTPWR